MRFAVFIVTQQMFDHGSNISPQRHGIILAVFCQFPYALVNLLQCRSAISLNHRARSFVNLVLAPRHNLPLSSC
jgi:hypothetical protein